MVTNALDALIVSRLPHRRMAESGWLDRFQTGWNLAHMVAIGGVALAGGGLRAPFVAMFFVSVVYSALTLPRARMLAIAFANVLALSAVGVLGDRANAWGRGLIYLPAAW